MWIKSHSANKFALIKLGKNLKIWQHEVLTRMLGTWRVCTRLVEYIKWSSALGSTLASPTNLTLEWTIPLLGIDLRTTLAQGSKEACKGFYDSIYYSIVHNSKKAWKETLSLIERGNTHRKRKQNMTYRVCNIYKQYYKMKELCVY